MIAIPPHRANMVHGLAAGLCILVCLAGCQPSREFTLRGDAEPTPELTGPMTPGVFAVDASGWATVIVEGRPGAGGRDDADAAATDDDLLATGEVGDLDSPAWSLRRGEDRLLIIVRILWRPRAGMTPIDPDAVNASLRVVMVARGEMGVYTGAGYAFPRDKDRSQRMRLSLWDATLTLTAASPGFVNPLGDASLVARIEAERDDQAVRRVFRELESSLSPVDPLP